LAGLLTQYSTTLNASSLKQLLDTVRPWSSGEESVFDPCNPKLCDLHLPGPKKFTLFQRSVIEKTYIPLLAAGESKADVVSEFASLCLAEFESIPEELELCEASLEVVMDSLTIWRAVLAVRSAKLDLETSQADVAESSQAVLTLFEMSDTSLSCGASCTVRRNIKALVGSVLLGNDFWKTKFDEYLEFKSIIAEFAQHLKDSYTQLTTTPPGSTETVAVLKTASELHLQVESKMRPDALKVFSQCLLTLTLQHTEAVQNEQGATDKIELLRSASDAVHTVSLALPHEMLIVDCSNEIADSLRKADSLNKVDSLRKALEVINSSTAATLPGLQDEIIANLGKSTGAPTADAERLDTFLK
jgi:hypothetical protein